MDGQLPRRSHTRNHRRQCHLGGWSASENQMGISLAVHRQGYRVTILIWEMVE